MLNIIICKIRLVLQSFLRRLIYRSREKHIQHNDRRLSDEIKVQLEWRMSEVMKTYPVLSMHEAEQVITMFYNGRHILNQEGWYIIDGFVKSVLYERR